MPVTIRHTCDRPILVVNPRYRSKHWSEDPHFTQRRSDYKMNVPCGHCLSCRQRRSRAWQFRLYQEAEHTITHRYTSTRKGKKKTSLAPRVLFCTFTFNEKYLPDIPKNDDERKILAPFIESWRDLWRKAFGVSPRYFAISDIGTDTGRLHLHVLLFAPRRKDGTLLSKKDFYVKHQEKGNTTPPPTNENCYWRFGFVTYCSYLDGMEGIHYVSGYMTAANAEKKAQRDGVPLHPKARTHFASIFCSQGLGKNFIFTNTFATLRRLKSSVCKVGAYTYSVPRYYKIYYFDPIESVVHHTYPIEYDSYFYLSREDQLSAHNARLRLIQQEEFERCRGETVVLLNRTPYHSGSALLKKKIADRLKWYYDPIFDYFRPSDNIDGWALNLFVKPKNNQLDLWQTTKTAPLIS